MRPHNRQARKGRHQTLCRALGNPRRTPEEKQAQLSFHRQAAHLRQHIAERDPLRQRMSRQLRCPHDPHPIRIHEIGLMEDRAIASVEHRPVQAVRVHIGNLTLKTPSRQLIDPMEELVNGERVNPYP